METCTILLWSRSSKIVIRQLDWRTQQRHRGPMVYYPCILASGRNGTLYIGMSNDLVRE